MSAGQELDVGDVVEAEGAGVLPHTQPLHGLELHGPGQDPASSSLSVSLSVSSSSLSGLVF